MQHVIAIIGLGLLIVGWFFVQRWREAARVGEPVAPVEGCGFCTHRDSCSATPPSDPLDCDDR